MAADHVSTHIGGPSHEDAQFPASHRGTNSCPRHLSNGAPIDPRADHIGPNHFGTFHTTAHRFCSHHAAQHGTSHRG